MHIFIHIFYFKHEANSELITAANSLFEISSIMLKWSGHMINMLLYEYGGLLTLVGSI